VPVTSSPDFLQYTDGTFGTPCCANGHEISMFAIHLQQALILSVVDCVRTAVVAMGVSQSASMGAGQLQRLISGCQIVGAIRIIGRPIRNRHTSTGRTIVGKFCEDYSESC
jgi:hypothetical protein